MKLIAVAVVALALAAYFASTMITAENTEVNGTFPKSFFFNGTTLSNTGVPGDATYRFDGYNNIYSFSLTYRNTAFPRNVTETYAYDFNRNITYMHSTGNDKCVAQRMQYTLPMNLIDFMDSVWYYSAKIVDDRYVSGHHYQTIRANYTAANVVYLTSDNDYLYRVNGTIAGQFSNVNVTRPFTPLTFSRDQHVPRACGN
uniref:Uncharacterized protein n=1 Tax=Euplotes harpa TaxID=151035 RepID=A0A7S3JE38_9SPIT|mmetsp:Transcript_35377/g.40898  ORF Transcript_35377/g.40898 Transcript_35377/m.40898 type:complete len:200 (+) Transcript_35377:26-625(+)